MHACLRACRSPLGFLLSDWRPGLWGAWGMGMRHGFYCLGCCWALMALLFVGGAMNLLWIAALPGLVSLEKLAPKGELVARALGVAMIGAGVNGLGLHCHETVASRVNKSLLACEDATLVLVRRGVAGASCLTITFQIVDAALRLSSRRRFPVFRVVAIDGQALFPGEDAITLSNHMLASRLELAIS